MPQITESAHVVNKVKTILKEFPIILSNKENKKEIVVSLSIGIIFSKSGEKLEYEELYHRADSCMYKAKKNGKGCAVIELKNGREQMISIS